MVLFRTTDYLNANFNRKEIARYYLALAKESGLEVLEYDTHHIEMGGNKWSFFKYYIRGMRFSVKCGQPLSDELKRIISVLFWK